MLPSGLLEQSLNLKPRYELLRHSALCILFFVEAAYLSVIYFIFLNNVDVG